MSWPAERSKAYRDARRAKGLCIQCGEDSGGRSRCKPCREYQVAAQAKRDGTGKLEEWRAGSGAYVCARSKSKARFREGHVKPGYETPESFWTLDKGEFFALVLSGCHYCSGPIAKGYGTCLDRVDNARGYHRDNVLPCCGSCNRIRSDKFSVDEMVRIGSVIREIVKERESCSSRPST